MSESIAEVATGSAGGPIPRGEKRRREIAAVAERVFFENGFSDTTMQTIALRAGASKETLYRHFGSKEGLFAEIVETRAESFLDDLDENFGRPGSVEAVLRDLATRLLESIIGPDAINLCRTVIAEGTRTPELGEIFFARGPERVIGRLSDYIAAARERGEVACADPEACARIFLGAIMGPFHLRRLCLQAPTLPTKAQVKFHVDEVIDMFLLKYASRAD